MIRTGRLILRLPEHEDVPEIVRFYTENRDHLEPWSPVASATFYTEGYWHDQVEIRRSEFQEGLGARLFIFPIDRPRRVVGNLSLTQILRGPAQTCNLGYSLAAEAQGLGYMLEAVEAAVRYAFEELGLHRIEASYMPHNHRSARVLSQAGFRIEGYATAYLLINGRWEDHVNTAIVNPHS